MLAEIESQNWKTSSVKLFLRCTFGNTINITCNVSNLKIGHENELLMKQKPIKKRITSLT